MAPPEDRTPPTPPSYGKLKVRDPYADLLRDTRGLRREQAAAGLPACGGAVLAQ